ncbi:hypothetical protein [Cellulomonas oligotrophica]|uniref:Uncharacterized protein n=1 Tax=Cellulomonas oligotrophica TaxID=931536 RepID=A0A7Y9FGS6_9CELL|nr:hypothetical protein [Cellulomonas oligotrophica]NYD86757.1 hypothetical protein [Cellulomonas oligotrophica]GIG32457.1 hypothetical protein Col01nite_16160 [Cellulomonas oligotrophica]
MTVPDGPPPPRPHKDGWSQTPGDAWQRSGRTPRDAPGAAPRRDDVVRAGAPDRTRGAETGPPAPSPAAWRPEEEWLPDPRPAPERAWTPEHEWTRFTGDLAAEDAPRARPRRLVAALVGLTVAATLLAAAGAAVLLG